MTGFGTDPLWLSAIALIGLVVLGIAGVRRWLTPSGIVAAAAVGGAVSIGFGHPGLMLLVFFFVSSSMLTRILRVPTERLGADRDYDGRTAGQVLANSGIAAGAGLCAWLAPGGSVWTIAFSGAIAAATADTWSSEVGEWKAAATRLITTGVRVDPGTNGGVSWPGSAAAGVAALAVSGLAALAFDQQTILFPVATGGAVGAIVDSAAGATIEGRARWIRNDTINWIGTFAGAGVAVILG